MSLIDIGKVNRMFEDAVRAQDPDRLASLYTGTAMALPPDGPIVRGQDGIRQLWSTVMKDMGLRDVTLKTVDLDVDRHEPSVVVTLEGGAGRRIQQRDDVAIVVGDGVDVVEADVGEIVHVGVGLEPAQEAPAAVELGVGFLAIHEADGPPLDGDVVARKARAPSPRERQDLVRAESIPLGQRFPP